MEYPKDITDIVSDLIKTIDLTSEILVVDELPNGDFKLKLSDIFHAQPKFEIKIDNSIYDIVSVDEKCETIVVSGDDAPTVGTKFEFYKPNFFHGTVQQVANELTKIDEKGKFPNDKIPMIYLFERFEQKFINDPYSVLERESDIVLIFLTKAKFDEFSTRDLYSQCVKPMQKLLQHFILALENSKIIKTRPSLENYNIINESKFGVYSDSKGTEKNLFSDNLSGIEFTIKLKILRDACEDC